MKLGIVILLILLSIIQVCAQKSGELSDVDTRLVALVQEKLPDWNHETIEPMLNSPQVAIHRWTFRNKEIRVTIVDHGSIEVAKNGIRKFVVASHGIAESPDAGDEQYSTRDRGSIVLRKRHFTVNMNATATDEKDEKKLLKEFARYIGSAIRDN
ncbi:MAG TPA: hypothetical protein VN643_23225 [Pyrinomonadaceae bacterium]|nr:hypothetical protein [Pyrinomonadaceae bacterium]